MLIIFQHIEFTPIPGYEGLYAISRDGQVLRESRKMVFADSVGTIPAKILKRVNTKVPTMILTKSGKHTHWKINELLERTFS